MCQHFIFKNFVIFCWCYHLFDLCSKPFLGLKLYLGIQGNSSLIFFHLVNSMSPNLGLLASAWIAMKRAIIMFAVPTAHTALHLGFSDPEPVDHDPLWSVGEAARMETVQRRKHMLEVIALCLLGRGRSAWDDAKEYLVSDVEFEDPTARIIGRENLGLLVAKASDWLEDGNVSTKKVVHFQDKVTIDWEPSVRLRKSFLKGRVISVPMRTNFYLERDGPATPNGGDSQLSDEKVWRIEEEWYGKSQLNKNTVFPSLLGSVYQATRRGVGFAIIGLAKAGIV